MKNPSAQIIARVKMAERSDLLAVLAGAIVEMTTLARSHYDNDNAADNLRRIIEAIHHLAGHLRDLCDPREPFTESRAAGVREQLEVLPPSALSRLCEGRR